MLIEPSSNVSSACGTHSALDDSLIIVSSSKYARCVNVWYLIRNSSRIFIDYSASHNIFIQQLNAINNNTENIQRQPQMIMNIFMRSVEHAVWRSVSAVTAACCISRMPESVASYSHGNIPSVFACISRTSSLCCLFSKQSKSTMSHKVSPRRRSTYGFRDDEIGFTIYLHKMPPTISACTRFN